MAKAAPGGQGGSKTQLTEINRIKGTYKCQFCIREHSHFSQIQRTDGFLNFIRSLIPWTIRRKLTLEKTTEIISVSQIPNARHDRSAGHFLSGSIIHGRLLECRGKEGQADSCYSQILAPVKGLPCFLFTLYPLHYGSLTWKFHERRKFNFPSY